MKERKGKEKVKREKGEGKGLKEKGKGIWKESDSEFILKAISLERDCPTYIFRADSSMGFFELT